ncbi:hypothetical protein [Rhizobium lentis]|uniref:hypothetical protein n=1 Tax=Rhizobium lentis TaxID=1138194 RepID=UPI002180B701|nr:hypothetical protein [Rhizobium lentis]
MSDHTRAQFEAAVVERMKESGFLEIEIRTECLVRCDEGYEDEVINAGWHYWNAALAVAAAPPAEGGRDYQARVAKAHHALFHDDPTDVEERLARFFEEAVETCQALGMNFADAHKLVNYTYDRPVGEPAKEIGAAMLTLASLCVVAGYDLMECAEADLEKLQRPETIARIRAKRTTRHGRGPLPGFDPNAGQKPCGIADPSSRDCPNMKEVGGGMDGERYRCAVCGKSYYLDYEEMK